MRQFSCISDHKRWPDHQHHGKEIDGACLVAGTQQLLLSLHNAARADADAVPDVQDARQNLATSLARLSQVSQHSVMPCQAMWPVRFTMCRSSPAMRMAQNCVAEGYAWAHHSVLSWWGCTAVADVCYTSQKTLDLCRQVQGK